MWLAAILLAATGACGGRTSPGEPPRPTPAAGAPPAPDAAPAPGTPATAPGNACALLGAPEPTRDSLTLGLAEPVDPAHAPVPTNRAERLLFAQLYEPLVRLDCTGALRPALAESWQSDDGGTSWVLTLRPDARFADGSPVTAADVVQGWRGRPGIAGASALGDRRVAVTLAVPAPEGPFALAQPEYAVAKQRPGAWPLGTGPYQLDGGARLATGARPALLIRRTAGSDPRDLLDGGADLLVTDDPTALAYARQRNELTVVSLPWDRHYLFAVPAGAGGAAPLSPEGQAALARDAVRVEARPAELVRCDRATPEPSPSGTVAAHSAPIRIVYPRGDPVARDLAARLLALGRTGPGGRAVGLGPDELEAAMRAGRDAAVVALAGSRAACMMPEAWSRELMLLPLIDTRAAAVVRRGAAAPLVDADGTLRWPRTETSAAR
jgi:hypothetical protein